MKLYKFHIFFSSLLFIIVCSCSSDFSRYQKNGKNDLEKNHLIGNVKTVAHFFEGELTNMQRYNQYGFITEDIDYSNGEIVEKRTYTYNEYGKIRNEDINNKKCHYAELKEYDDNGNVIEEHKETYEVFGNTEQEIGKILQYTYKYEYDKYGSIIKYKKYKRDGICIEEVKYNQTGKLSEVVRYNDDGTIETNEVHIYSGYVETIEITSPNHMTIKSTTQYDFSGNIVMFSRTGLFPQTDKYEYDKNNRVIKKETTYIGEGNYDKGEIHHETIIYDRDEYGSVIRKRLSMKMRINQF